MANKPKLGLGSDTAERAAALVSILPALRSWIDNVIVPALVREFLEDSMGRETGPQRTHKRTA